MMYQKTGYREKPAAWHQRLYTNKSAHIPPDMLRAAPDNKFSTRG